MLLLRILMIASFSALVTQSPYFFLMATCLATYAHLNGLFGGSQVAASPSPFCELREPLTASKLSGSFAKAVRVLMFA
jgi:hypothetical protein